MLQARQNNKRAVETFLVAKGSGDSAALYNTAGSGNSLTNGSGNIVLSDGQLGFFDGSGMGTNTLHDATDVNPTIAESPVIYIAQGTASSADVAAAQAAASFPLPARPYERSGDFKSTHRFLATKQLYAAPTHSTWVIGGSGGAIVPYDNTEYQMRIAYRGRRMDEFYNPEGTNHFNPHFVTPNYTSLGTAQPLDHLVQNLAWNINRNSKILQVNRTRFKGNEPVVALAISTNDDGSGVNIGGNGAAETPIAAGDVIPVVNTNFGVRNITLTEAQATSIKNAAVAASGDAIANVTWHILTIDLSNAGTATGGTADVIMLLALDADLAYVDRIPQVKTRLDVGLTMGFDYNTVYHEEVEEAYEGTGSGRVWNILYENTHGQRKHMLRQRKDWPFTEYASPVDTAATYVSYQIENVEANQIDTSNLSESPQKTTVLIPSSETTLITAFDTALNSWLASAGQPSIITV